MRATSIAARLAVLALGTLTALALVEVGLRVGGLQFRLTQWIANRAPDDSSATRVVCLGESTTALGGDSAWPAQLEDVLAERAGAGRFVVVNAAIPGAWSQQVVDHLDQNLPFFSPDILVAMMGANDTNLPLTNGLEGPWDASLWAHFRLYRLLRMSSWVLTHPDRFTIPRDEGRAEEVAFWARISEDHGHFTGPIHQGRAQLAAGRVEEALESFQAADAMEPIDAECALMIGWCLRTLGRSDEAEPWYAEAMHRAGRPPPQRGPPPPSATEIRDLVELTDYFGVVLGGDVDLTRIAAEVAVEHMPDDPRAWRRLAESAFLAGEEDRALEAWRRVLALTPGDPSARLGTLRQLAQRDPVQAEAELDAFLEEHPDSVGALLLLARLQRASSRWPEAEASARAALALEGSVEARLALAAVLEATDRQPAADRVLRGAVEQAADCHQIKQIVTQLEAEGRHEAASRLLEAPSIQQAPSNCREQLVLPELTLNSEGATRLRASYARLHELAESSGARLVAVQYPTLPAAPLRAVLPHDPDIAVVDNQEAFHEAIRRRGYGALFADRCYATFGHGAAAGNRLLAERVADAILTPDGAPAVDVAPSER